MDPNLTSSLDSPDTLDSEALTNALVRASFTAEEKDGLRFDLGQGRSARVPRDEFPGALPFAPGDELALLVEEDIGDFFTGSVTKAEKLLIWRWLERLKQTGDPVEGTIVAENKGGVSVDIGVRAFLPRSHVDLHRIDDCSPYLGREATVQVIKFDKKKGDIVVSRRNLLEKEQKAERKELLKNLEKGQTYEGVVRNLTDFGAFVDIGGIDGLLHITNMSWGRVDHPSELVRPGDTLEVVVLDWNPKKKRLGLGRKQLLDDPWADVAERFTPGQIVDGKVVSLADFGAFVAIAPGLEGLVHVSELSWTRRINHPKEVLNRDQDVKVKILSIAEENRRLSLSIREIEENPWIALANRLEKGTRLSGPIRNITDFGIFVQVEEGIEGLVHVSDLSWTQQVNPAEKYKVGDDVEVVVLDVDPDAQRIGLGIKQLEDNPWEKVEEIAQPGKKIDVTITRITEFGAFASIVEGVEGLIHISELSEERVNKATEVVRPGQTVNALVMSFDASNQRIGLSLKRDDLEDVASDMREYTDDPEAASTTLGDLMRDRLGLSEDSAPELD